MNYAEHGKGPQLDKKRQYMYFIHSFIAICKAHYIETVESEVLEAVARWSVIGKVEFLSCA